MKKILFAIALSLSSIMVHGYVIPSYGIMAMNKKAPVVFAGECDRFRKALQAASIGQEFLVLSTLSSTCTPNNIRDNLRKLIKASTIIQFHGGLPVIQVDCGQFILEKDTDVLSTHDSYVQSMNLIRGFLQGGYADICCYEDADEHLRKAIRYMGKNLPKMDRYFTGHAFRCYPYENSMCRIDSITLGVYACSAHILWMEENNVEHDRSLWLLRKVNNAIGFEVNSHTDMRRLIKDIRTVNPTNDTGKILLLTNITGHWLQDAIRLIQKEKLNVCWCANIDNERTLHHVMRVHKALGTWTGVRMDPHETLAYKIADYVSERLITPTRRHS